MYGRMDVCMDTCMYVCMYGRMCTDFENFQRFFATQNNFEIATTFLQNLAYFLILKSELRSAVVLHRFHISFMRLTSID